MEELTMKIRPHELDRICQCKHDKIQALPGYHPNYDQYHDLMDEPVICCSCHAIFDTNIMNIRDLENAFSIIKSVYHQTQYIDRSDHNDTSIVERIRGLYELKADLIRSYEKVICEASGGMDDVFIQGHFGKKDFYCKIDEVVSDETIFDESIFDE